MPFVSAPDGIRLHYDLEGDGPPLLLHLGSGCDSDLWRAAGYVEPLSEELPVHPLRPSGSRPQRQPK